MLDLTNSSILDCSPFTERKSNFIPRATATRPLPLAKPMYSKPMYATATATLAPKNISRVPVAPVVTPTVVVATPLPLPTTPTTPTTPTAPSGGGGGGASGGGEPSQKKAETDSTETPTTAVANKEFYMKMWFWGLLVGGVAGYLYAKNKGKDLKSFALIGAGVGGFAGLVVEKYINKGVNPNATNVTVVNAVPSEEQQQEQQ